MTVAEEGLPAEGTVAEGAAAGVAVAPQRRATSFAGDVLKLVSGTTLAQAIGVLITPILTRMYAPEAFGTLALFTSITGIISVVACLRYELAIMLPETDEEAANLLAVSLVAVVAITALTVPAVTLGRPLLVRLLKAPDLGPYLWLVPIAVFFGGVFQALNYWNSRTKRFGRLSVVRVVNSLVTHIAKLGGGLASYSHGGSLIGATALGSVISTGVLAGSVLQEEHGLFRRAVRPLSMLGGARQHYRFPLFSTWSGLLNTISWQLPAILLSSFFSTTVAGHYSLGLRVLQLPMSLIGGAIGQVFYQRAAEANEQGTLDQVVWNSFETLSVVGLFPILILGVVGREAFTLVFGSAWAESGWYVQILSVWIFFWFVSTPISTTISVLDRQSFGLFINVIILITRFLSLWMGGILDSPELALGLFSLSGAASYGYLSLKLCTLCGIPLSRPVSLLWKIVLLFVPAAAFLLFLRLAGLPAWAVSACAALAVFAYYALEGPRHPQILKLAPWAGRRLRWPTQYSRSGEG